MAWNPHGPAAGAAPAGEERGGSGGEHDGGPRGYYLGPMRGGFPSAERPAPAGPPAARPRPSPAGRRGETSLGVDAATLAGLSYLGWWFTGLLIYFNERENRFVRFHALQSVVYTGALTIAAVLGYVASALLSDAELATHQRVYGTLAQAVGLLTVAGVVFAWCVPLIAAWSGVKLRLPVVAGYAERYAAPVAAEGADGTDGGATGG